MARPRNSKNRMNLNKESDKLKKVIEEAESSATTPEEKLLLLELGAGISLNTLIRAAAGDPSIAGISATNMISAADKLLGMYVKVIGKDGISDLDKPKELTQTELTEEQKDALSKEVSNLSFLGRYNGEE